MAELLTSTELARELKISRDTVRNWVRDRRIPEIRVNDKVRRFLLDDVMAALKRPVHGGNR
jgi:excisionase family DNA binding protein